MKAPLDKESQREILRKLISMAQEMMMEGQGDDEGAGDKIADSLKDGSLAEEPSEEVAEAMPGAEDAEQGPEDLFKDYRNSEMKRGGRSPIKDRKVAVVVAARPAKAHGKGRY